MLKPLLLFDNDTKKGMLCIIFVKRWNKKIRMTVDGTAKYTPSMENFGLN
jgi:hypothetical protein